MSFSFCASLVSIELLGNHFIFHNNFGPLKNNRIEYFHFALLHSSLKVDVEVQNNCSKLGTFPYRRNGQLQVSFSLVFCLFFFSSGIEGSYPSTLFMDIPNEVGGAHCLVSPHYL